MKIKVFETLWMAIPIALLVLLTIYLLTSDPNISGPY